MDIYKVALDTVYALALVLYIFLEKPLESPFAFAGVTIGLIHSIICAIKSMHNTDEDVEEEFSIIVKISESMCQLLPMSCSNIHFYLKSETLRPYAYAHAFTLLVFFCSIFATVYEEDYENSPIDYLKSITVIFNCLSMCYVGYIESKFMYIDIAGMVLLTNLMRKVIKMCGYTITRQCGNVIALGRLSAAVLLKRFYYGESK